MIKEINIKKERIFMVTRKKFIDFPRSNKITGVNPYLFLLMFYD